MKVEDFFAPQILELLKNTVTKKGFEVSLKVGRLLDTYVVNNIGGKLTINPLPLWSGDGANPEDYIFVSKGILFRSEKYHRANQYVSRYIDFDGGHGIWKNNNVIGLCHYANLYEGAQYTITCDSGSMLLETEVVVLNNRLHVLKVYQDGNLLKTYEHCLVEAVICDYNSGFDVGATELVPVSNASWCDIHKTWKKYI